MRMGLGVETEETISELPEQEDLELAYYQKHYKGWTRSSSCPSTSALSSFSFTDR